MPPSNAARRYQRNRRTTGQPTGRPATPNTDPGLNYTGGDGQQYLTDAGADSARENLGQPDVFLPPGTQPGGGGSTGIYADSFYLNGFPEFPTVDFPEIDPANFGFTDPIDFAGRFSEFQRGELNKNFAQAQDFALKGIDTELQGLKQYLPAAAAIARGQTSIDNIYNLEQRRSAIKGALPQAQQDLAGRRSRALAYSEGRIPDEQQNTAFELGIRSRAADRSSAVGIGPKSLASGKISDLMSAEDRLQIAQYGEELYGQNLSQEAQLFLPPTQYSQVGAQVPLTPEVGAGRQTASNFSAVNQASLISPGQALQSEIGQQEFVTNIEQRTNEFNATGQFNADRFNSEGQFKSALGKFGYDAQYLSSIQAGNQANLNFSAALELQQLENEGFVNGQQQAQNSDTISSIITAIGGVGSKINNSGILSPNSNTSGGASGGSGGGASGGGSGGASGGGVTQPSVDTTPTEIPGLISEQPIPGVTAPDTGSLSRGVDSSVPSSTKFSQGTPLPTGYVSAGNNNDGTYTAVQPAAYKSEMERFAKSSSVPVSAIDAGVLASTDKAIARSASLSYVPIEGFRPVALSAGGKQVYSLPAASESTNLSAGSDKIFNSSVIMAQLGAGEGAVQDTLSELGTTIGDVSTVDKINVAFADGGGVGAAEEIGKILGIESASLETRSGQSLKYGASQIGSLWGSLSVDQKTSALSSLAPALIEEKTGKQISEQVVDGTEGAVGGELNVGQVSEVLAKGRNGMALARNWDQLSAFSSIVSDNVTPNMAAQIGDYAGLLGFGPQGAAINLPNNYLEDVGAKPAPSMGVGAALFGTVEQVPSGYEVIDISPDGEGVVALPANLKHTANGSFKQSAIAASHGHPAQKLWGDAPSEVIKGSAGGSAMISGMNLMKDNNTVVNSSILSYAMFSNTMGK